MNTRTNKTVLLIILMICLATAVYSAVGTFTFRTSGASDTTEVVDLRYPQKVPEDSSVTTDSIADGSITNDKLAEPISVANGGTGKTTAAEALAALGGASLNGSSTVDFSAQIHTASESIISAISPGSNGYHTTQAAVHLLDPDAVASVSRFGATATMSGHLYIYDASSGKHCIYTLVGAATTEVTDPTNNFSISKDNAGTINIYCEGGFLRVQNKLGVSRQVFLTFTGFKY